MQRSRSNWRLVLLCLSLAILAVTPVCGQKTGAKPGSSLTAIKTQISRGELDTAERSLWNVLSSDPNRPDALMLLGIIRGRQKRYAEADALFRRVLQLDPASWVARQNLAAALVAQDKPDAAILEYKELLKQNPRDNPAKLELARLYLAEGDFSQALSTLDSIPENRLPLSAVPAKAASLLGVGKKEEASALIPRLKQSPAVAAELAEVFLNGHAPEYALKTIEAALAATPRSSSRLFYLKGRALQDIGDRAGALSSFRTALARDPKSIDALISLASVLAADNKHSESFALLNRALALRPDSPTIFRPLIIEAIKVGERRTALKAAHALAEKSSDNPDDLYLSAAAMLEGREFATATPLLEQYVKQRPEDSKGFLGLGIGQLGQRKYVEAGKALERALELNPNLADAEYQLGVLSDQEGETAEAFRHYEHAVQLQPQHAKALASLAEHYLQQGDLQKAHPLLERSLTSDPNNSQTHYDMALVLAKLGRTEEAKQHMERFHSLKAGHRAEDSPSAK
jgi:Flp pilus assembly protein TadD